MYRKMDRSVNEESNPESPRFLQGPAWTHKFHFLSASLAIKMEAFQMNVGNSFTYLVLDFYDGLYGLASFILEML